MSVYLLIFLALNRFELGGKGFYLDTVFKKFNSLVFLGPVSNPVAFAFMAGIFIIIFYMFAHIGILKERFFAFSVFISTFCLGLTRCRTGIVAVAFVLFPLLFVAARPLRKALAVSVISGLILSLGLVHAAFLSNQTAKFSKERILQAEGVERIDEGTFFFVSKSDIKREETNLLAWDLFKQNWFFGAGLGATYKYSDKILEHPSIANNTLLLYLADTGLTGIVFILLFFY
ncbi:MAG: O-antigen ligase family protein, partial [bacterium]|nr:O-antigen ligase family protein [bacterium]